MAKIFCASGSIEGLQKLINEYFYSTNYVVNPDLSVTNEKMTIRKDFIKVIKRKNRYLAYLN